jgi:hypothetical protein
MSFKRFLLEQRDILRTHKGSPIKRHNHGSENAVGKIIGGQIYVHKDYAHLVIPNDVLEHSKQVIKGNFEYNSNVYDIKKNLVRFDSCQGFDEEREPVVGEYVWVLPDGATKKGKSPYIWHHKWCWVKDDYKGFDVDESYEWSRLWLSKFEEPASGVMRKWQEQLKKYGLV